MLCPEGLGLVQSRLVNCFLHSGDFSWVQSGVPPRLPPPEGFLFVFTFTHVPNRNGFSARALLMWVMCSFHGHLLRILCGRLPYNTLPLWSYGSVLVAQVAHYNPKPKSPEADGPQGEFLHCCRCRSTLWLHSSYHGFYDSPASSTIVLYYIQS